MYNHVINQTGPGTAWNLETKQLLIGSHRTTLNNLFSAEHYHLYVKSAYAKAYIFKTSDLAMWSGLYDKMQIARVGVSKREKFDELLESFLEVGFNQKYPIPVNRNYQILDGSHRVAASFALDKDPYVEVYANQSHSYTRSWFQSVGFTKADLERIDSFQTSMTNTATEEESLNVGIIWNSALNYWEEIFSMIKSRYLLTAFCVELGNQDELINFILKSYQGDGMAQDRIIKKSIQLSKYGAKIGMFALKNMSQELIIDLKKNIRTTISAKMNDYFFDNVVHILDCKITSRTILSTYSPKNTY